MFDTPMITKAPQDMVDPYMNPVLPLCCRGCGQSHCKCLAFEKLDFAYVDTDGHVTIGHVPLKVQAEMARSRKGKRHAKR
jgi:hypothetical protein